MSLIQQALEKSSRAQMPKTKTPVAAPRPWERDPTGADLEKKIIQVQKNIARRRIFQWRNVTGVLLLGVIAGIFYLGISQARLSPAVSVPVPPPSVVETPAPQVPLQVVTGDIFHLTGITSFGGKPMAVINEKIVTEGSSLSGMAIVKQIGNGEVRLDVHGREIRLTL